MQQNTPVPASFNHEGRVTKRSLLAIVPVHTPSRQREYIWIDDIPILWRLAFIAALGARERPIRADQRPAAYAWDWRDWVMDQSWDVPDHVTLQCTAHHNPLQR